MATCQQAQFPTRVSSVGSAGQYDHEHESFEGAMLLTIFVFYVGLICIA